MRNASLVLVVGLALAACGNNKKSQTIVGAADLGERDRGQKTADRPADVSMYTNTGDPLAWLKPVYFAFDSSELSADTRATLQQAHDYLAANPAVTLTIEGHCDEQGTTEYNIALGQRRAQAMTDYLARLGIAGKRLSAVSFGSERPAADGHDEIAHAQNRRGELKVAK